MRILLTTRGSAGHLNPLAPFGHAALRAGHEVLVAAQRQHAGNVERAGLPFAAFGEPPPEQWMPLLGEFGEMDLDTANAAMIGEYFARMDTAAALPGLRAIVEDWRPDVIVRDCWEYASTLVAELHGIPVVRVALGLAAVEALSIDLAAAAVDAARAELGLPPDPAGDRLRETPFLTMVPEALEDPAPWPTHRFRHAVSDAAPPLPDWWPGNDDPLVYVTFGSVTAGEHLPYFPALYRARDRRARAAAGARAPDDRRPPRSRASWARCRPTSTSRSGSRRTRWCRTRRRSSATAGTGRRSARSPTACRRSSSPLFSIDQWANAAAVERAGAGVALDADRAAGACSPAPAPR